MAAAAKKKAPVKRRPAVKTVVPKPSFFREWGWLIVAVIVVAQQVGWLTIQQADAIKKLVPVEAPRPVVVEAAPKPEDIQKWADLIRRLIDENRSAPTPTPIEPVKPPVPQPIESKIKITDENGKPVVTTAVEAGSLFLATTSGTEVAWQVSRHGSVRVAALPGNAGFAFSLDAGSFVELFLTEFSTKTQASIRITCGDGPRPPPHVVPDVEPIVPDVPVVTSRKLALEVVVDYKKITPETAIVLNSVDDWNSLILDGHTWRFFSHASTEAAAKQAIADSAKTTIPTLCIYDQKSRWPIAAIPLPTSVDDLKAVVEKYAGGAK